MPFIPCNIHAVHNAFRVGIYACGEASEELVIDLVCWLKNFPLRREDSIRVIIRLGLDDDFSSLGMYTDADGLHSFPHWTELSRNEKQSKSTSCKNFPN